MKVSSLLLASVAAIIVAYVGSVLAIPLAFAGRALPGLQVGEVGLGGAQYDAVEGMLNAFEEELRTQPVQLALRGHQATTTLGELGLGVDKEATILRIGNTTLSDVVMSGGAIVPVLTLAEDRLDMSVSRLFPGTLTAPQNASLSLTGAEPLTLIPSRRGERANNGELLAHISDRLRGNNWNGAIEIVVIEEAATVQDDEVEQARQLASKLLGEGFSMSYADQTFELSPIRVERLMTFIPRPDPTNPANHILGVRLDQAGLEVYLTETLRPLIDQTAQDARFVVNEAEEGIVRVTQFALPKVGQTLNIPRTLSHVAASLDQNQNTSPLAVDVTSPQVGSLADIEKLGLTNLLAKGESDFAGSPKNRIHNITVGASRYHGLLIAPNQEFSFNEFLGPVDGQHGFLPELVIKHNVTTPEYGGGLCQVSTTAFRAALQAGLEITARRNHAYAVRYYGTPGLDATIYPPITDLKFRNNTPGYILMQTNIVGTKIFFDFWGTPDGRTVEVVGPVTYNRQANGAVSAYVDQKVTKNGELIIDERLYSRYRSPQLFPKVLAANGEGTP